MIILHLLDVVLCCFSCHTSYFSSIIHLLWLVKRRSDAICSCWSLFVVVKFMFYVENNLIMGNNGSRDWHFLVERKLFLFPNFLFFCFILFHFLISNC